MDNNKKVRLLIIVLFGLFIMFQYIKIPYFGVLFFITVFLIIRFHKSEKDAFMEKFKQYQFDFSLRKHSNVSKMILNNVIFLLLIVAPIFIKIPYEIRDFSAFDYVYIISFWVILIYVGSLYKFYMHYYFSKVFIKKPGKNFDMILWNDIAEIEVKDDQELFILHLKTGETLKFGSDLYNTLGKNKNEIIKYIRQLI